MCVCTKSQYSLSGLYNTGKLIRRLVALAGAENELKEGRKCDVEHWETQKPVNRGAASDLALSAKSSEKAESVCVLRERCESESVIDPD